MQPVSKIQDRYAIIPNELNTAIFTRKVNTALADGLRLLQYRKKNVDDALNLEQIVADYAASGACFSLNTQPHTLNALLKVFSRAKKEFNFPCVAIGGIALQNTPLVLNVIAHNIVVINALFILTISAETATVFARFFNA